MNDKPAVCPDSGRVRSTTATLIVTALPASKSACYADSFLPTCTPPAASSTRMCPHRIQELPHGCGEAVTAAPHGKETAAPTPCRATPGSRTSWLHHQQSRSSASHRTVSPTQQPMPKHNAQCPLIGLQASFHDSYQPFKLAALTQCHAGTTAMLHNEQHSAPGRVWLTRPC